MGHLSYNENSIALPSDRGMLEVSGANLMYEGARVKSWLLGRDVNPAGRGDGAYYAQGAFRVGSVRPSPTTTWYCEKADTIVHEVMDLCGVHYHSRPNNYWYAHNIVER